MTPYPTRNCFAFANRLCWKLVFPPKIGEYCYNYGCPVSNTRTSLDKADPQAKEVLRYQDAVSIGFKRIQARPIISTKLFCELASVIKQSDMQVRKLPGTRIVNSATGKVIYSPPEGEAAICGKLRNLESSFMVTTAYIH